MKWCLFLFVPLLLALAGGGWWYTAQERKKTPISLQKRGVEAFMAFQQNGDPARLREAESLTRQAFDYNPENPYAFAAKDVAGHGKGR